MIIGTGIDVVNIERMERVIARWKDLFLHRVFTDEEIRWCRKRIRPAQCFAARFAAKEAFFKAIGGGLRNGVQWIDVQVKNDPQGKPFLSFHQKAKQVLDTLRFTRSFLTLSHEPPLAVAHVILEGKNHEGSDR